MLSLILHMKSAETFQGCGQREQQRQWGEAKGPAEWTTKASLSGLAVQLQGNTGYDDFVVQKWVLENLIMDQYHELFAQIVGDAKPRIPFYFTNQFKTVF